MVRIQANSPEPGSPKISVLGCWEVKYPYPMLKAIKTNAATRFGVIMDLRLGLTLNLKPPLPNGAPKELPNSCVNAGLPLKKGDNETAWFGLFAR